MIWERFRRAEPPIEEGAEQPIPLHAYMARVKESYGEESVLFGSDLPSGSLASEPVATEAPQADLGTNEGSGLVSRIADYSGTKDETPSIFIDWRKVAPPSTNGTSQALEVVGPAPITVNEAEVSRHGLSQIFNRVRMAKEAADNRIAGFWANRATARLFEDGNRSRLKKTSMILGGLVVSAAALGLAYKYGGHDAIDGIFGQSKEHANAHGTQAHAALEHSTHLKPEALAPVKPKVTEHPIVTNHLHKVVHHTRAVHEKIGKLTFPGDNIWLHEKANIVKKLGHGANDHIINWATNKVLRLNHISPEQARHLPLGFKFKDPFAN